MRTQKIGRWGEDLAARFLVGKGYKILARNWRTRYGEVDIVAELNNVIHFVEVKTRTGLKTGEPEEAINYFKMRRLLLAGQGFLLMNKTPEARCQLDSLAVILDLSQKSAKMRFKENITF